MSTKSRYVSRGDAAVRVVVYALVGSSTLTTCYLSVAMGILCLSYIATHPMDAGGAEPRNIHLVITCVCVLQAEAIMICVLEDHDKNPPGEHLMSERLRNFKFGDQQIGTHKDVNRFFAAFIRFYRFCYLLWGCSASIISR